MSNSFFNQDNTLPGVITEITSHYSASEYDTSLFGTTDGVVIIGTAFDGPTGEPTPVYSVDHAGYVFGKSYDSKTHREASLVADIQDAWNHGCRTIYAMRINGKEMYKDFSFNTDCPFKLRIHSRYPSNVGKQVYVEYNNAPGLESFTIYKPASRATIKEKVNGLVESSNSVMVNKINIAQDYAFTKDSKLIDVLKIINTHIYNNVVELDIVDRDGNVVTEDPRVYEITLGFMYPGVYFMGRDKSLCEACTETNVKLVLDGDKTPIAGFENKYYTVLTLNTDVSKDLPIYAADVKVLREVFAGVGIIASKDNAYLAEAEISNKAFREDPIDYEESKMSDFEIYKRLGSGFAITAVAEKRVDSEGKELVPKIHEASLDDPQRIVPTGDGIYSVLEDTKIKFHVLGHDICADTVINGKMPKHTEFKTTVPNDITIMNGLVKLTAKVDSNDEGIPKSYNIRMYDYKTIPEIKKEEISNEVFEAVGFSTVETDITEATNVTPGEKAMFVSGPTTKLYVANEKGVFEEAKSMMYAHTSKYNGELKPGKAFYMAGKHPIVVEWETDHLKYTALSMENAPQFIGEGMKYIIVQDKGEMFLINMVDYTSENPYMSTLNTAFNDDNTQLHVYYQNHEIGWNYVTINYPYFDSLTMEDYVEMLNNSSLGNVFEFELTNEGLILKDEYVADADKKAAAEKSGEAALTMKAKVIMDADRVRGYNYSMHIPYYTADNFARHLAQHCTYTELKTFPTHGVIGCNRITDVSKTNLAKVVKNLKAFNWSMFVKNDLGRNMLNEDNLPYPIGRNLSVTLMQSRVTTPSGFQAIVNGASSYAGMVSSLSIGQSTTGQTINLVPMFQFSHSQLQTLSALGIVTVKDSFTKGYIITDGITMAPSDDLLRRLFNTRVMHFVEDYIRAVCEPFIGKANSLANRNSLNTALKSKLSTLEGELLRSFEFKIVDDGSADQYTYIDINYTIVPMNEIREIRNYIRVRN